MVTEDIISGVSKMIREGLMREFVTTCREAIVTVTKNTAVFKAKIVDGKINVPAEEREVLGLNEGDWIEVVLFKLS